MNNAAVNGCHRDGAVFSVIWCRIGPIIRHSPVTLFK